MPLRIDREDLGLLLLSGPDLEAALPALKGMIEQALELMAESIDRRGESEILASISKRTGNAVILTDPDGSIRWVNDAFTSLTGYTFDEAKGRKPGHLLQGPLTDRGAVARIRSRLQGGKGFHEILCNYHKNGHSYWVDIEVEPICDADGKILHYMSIERDISSQIAAMENLRKARDEAENARKFKASFIAALSHELRTPLNGVIGYSDLMLSESSLVAAQIEQLAVIRNSGLQMLDIIQEVTEFTQAESGLLRLEKKPFEPAAILDVLREQIQPRLQPGQEMEISASVEFEASALGDPDRIREILRHLLANAVSFTPKGKIGLRAWRQGEQLCFEVSDTGMGMDEETMSRLFTPFVHNQGEGLSFGGVGVGLCIVDKLLKMMNGGISVKSRLGEGSCFSLHLEAPLHRAEIKPPQAPGDWNGFRFLAVDDNLVNLQLLRRLLERGGAEVLMARDGEEAIALALKEKPDLVFMDLEMPVLNGIEATRRLRQENCQTPIIALTAHTDESMRVEALVAGMNDYLFKPVRSFADLSKTIDQHLAARNLDPKPEWHY
jgi:PAS domain S-box-containing protein